MDLSGILDGLSIRLRSNAGTWTVPAAALAQTGGGPSLPMRLLAPSVEVISPAGVLARIEPAGRPRWADLLVPGWLLALSAVGVVLFAVGWWARGKV